MYTRRAERQARQAIPRAHAMLQPESIVSIRSASSRLSVAATPPPGRERRIGAAALYARRPVECHPVYPLPLYRDSVAYARAAAGVLT